MAPLLLCFDGLEEDLAELEHRGYNRTISLRNAGQG